MRLSEIRGEAALDCIEAALELASKLMDDESVKDALTAGGGTTKQALAISKLLLSKEYRDCTIPVLAALSQESVDDYLAETTLPRMIGDVYEIITDKELLAFLSPRADVPGTTSEDTLEDSGQTS